MTPQIGDSDEPKKSDGANEFIGWRFNESYPDPLHPDSKSIWDIYRLHDADYPNKKLTVPVLFDKKTQKIVSNESSEIIVFLNEAFNAFVSEDAPDLNPSDAATQKAMAEWNDVVYPGLNDGVYRCGFARAQGAYDEAVKVLFACLDKMEQRLAQSRFLCGDALTLSDVRAWVSLVRFDAVYATHFKCNLRMIQHHYPNLLGYAREIYQMPRIKDTLDLEYTKKHYYGSHPNCNPRGIVPVGPEIDFETPHGRDKKLGGAKVEEVQDEEQKND